MKTKTKRLAILSLCAAMMLSCGVAVAETIPNITTPVAAEAVQSSVVAKIGDVEYETVQEAVNAVQNGETITLSKDVTEDITVTQTQGQYFTIDGAGKTLTGLIKVVARSDWNCETTMLTIKNLKFKATQTQKAFIQSEETNHYPHLTIDGCDFDGAANSGNVVAVRLKSTNFTTIKNCTGSNLHSFLQNTSGWNLTIEKVVVTNSLRGMSLGTIQNVALKEVEIEASDEKYGIRLDAALNSVVVIENCKVSAFIPVVIRNATANEYNVTVSGKNTMTAANTDGLWFAIGTTEYEENNQVLEESTGAVNVVLNDATLSMDGVTGSSAAKLGDTYYKSLEEMLATLTAGNTITLTNNLKLYKKLILPANVTFNGNGYSVEGTIAAEGNLTFAGVNKITSFSAGIGNVITIGQGASLELTGSGRMVIGHGNTFNIIGNVADAKIAATARATVTPSLIANGASFTGMGVNFNVTNAYVKFTNYCSSKTGEADGTFNFNVQNSIWEQGNKLAFEVPSNGKNPTVNFNLKDSVLTTTSHFIFSVAKGNVVIDNSNVNENLYNQLENRGVMTIKNGSVVHASNAVSSNAKNPGTLVVDNATYVGKGELSGADLGKGTLILKNHANVTLEKISKTSVYKDTTSTLTTSSAVDATTMVFDMVDYNFSLTPDKSALKATESLNVAVSINKAFYSAEYTFTYDTTKFSCAADTNDDGVIFVSNLFEGEAGVLATYTLVAKNDIQSVYEGDVFTVNGTAIQYKEQLLNGIVNNVTGDTETIKISLNYTAGVKADFVQGYSLVLVKGDDAGYAYNGVKMFYVEAYGAYAILVEGNVTAEMIDVALSKTTDCEMIRQSYNVNAEFVNDGVIDIKDSTSAYACSVLDFDVAQYMELYLRADVNGDCKVNIVDINAVVRNYTR